MAELSTIALPDATVRRRAKLTLLLNDGVKAIFDKADTNGDGAIDLTEMRVLLGMLRYRV